MRNALDNSVRSIAIIAFMAVCANIAQAQNNYSIGFINYLKEVEGLRLEVYRDGVGVKTIGYGHAVKGGECFGRITVAQADSLLLQDMDDCNRRITARYGSALSLKQTEILLDFYFNLGSMRSFPKMERAILNNDAEGMRREYKRFAGGRELKYRNKLFSVRYL